MKKHFFSITISLLFVLISASCKKDNTNQTQNIQLQFKDVSAGNSLNYSNTYTTTSGQRFTLSEFRYYISGISLIKNDGSKFPITNKYFLVSPSIPNYDLGKVPTGNYKGIEFSVGIDSATNHLDPATYDASNPLAIQSPPIHWAWNPGYIFVKLEGMCDTTIGNNGNLDQTLIYHLGLDENLRKIIQPLW